MPEELSPKLEVPEVGFQLNIPADHYFFFGSSSTLTVRLKKISGIWQSVPPLEHFGLIVFLPWKDIKSTFPLRIQLTEVQQTVAFAKEV